MLAGKMLVTGGAGFVGSHAVEHFADEGWGVTAIDNLSRGRVLGQPGIDTANYSWKYLSGKRNIELVNASICDASLVDRLVKDVDVVIHTAGQVAVTASLKNPRGDFEANMQGTFTLLEACRKARRNITLVFCSTNKVYGENVNSIPVKLDGDRYIYADDRYARGLSESFSVDNCKHTPYGVSKLAADLYVQEYGRTYGLKTAVFRMSCIYGARQIGNPDQGWVAHFILTALRNKEITIYGDGKQVRDVLYVDDLVAAYDAFLRSGLTFGLFNIGGGPRNTLSLLELVAHIEKMLNKKLRVSFGEWRDGDQKVYVSNIDHVTRTLKWVPKVSVQEGLLRVFEWAKSETSRP
jgi:CDP-paratose 2-epimerase